jgi:hypothetical protein
MLPKNNSLFDKIEKKPVFMRLLSILSACFLFDKIGDNIVAKQFIIIADSDKGNTIENYLYSILL